MSRDQHTEQSAAKRLARQRARGQSVTADEAARSAHQAMRLAGAAVEQGGSYYERRLARRMRDPEFREAYERALRRTRRWDLIRRLLGKVTRI